MSNSDNIDNQEAVKLEACPFCGSDEVDVIEFSAHGPAYVNCEGCGMQTPNASTFEEALAAWNTRTPAKLDAPDNQEALAGEGVEVGQRLFLAIAHGDEEHRTWLQEAITAFFRGAEVPPPRGDGRKVARIAELEAQLAAATLPSNEALAGDDRNGVEGLVADLAGARPYVELAAKEHPEEIVRVQAQLELDRLDAALSRTPSSPQAEVERVEQVISAWALAHDIDGAARNDLFRRLRESAPTMTTRPAGVEELTEGAVLAWMRRTGRTSIALIDDVDAHIAALTPPQATEERA